MNALDKYLSFATTMPNPAHRKALRIQATAELASLRATLDEAREAIEPFAKAWEEFLSTEEGFTMGDSITIPLSNLCVAATWWEKWYEMRTGNHASAESAHKQLAQLRAAQDEAREAISAYLLAGMHTHNYIALEVVQRTCPRCIARENLSAWLEKWKEMS